jgi:hypothetical protein
MSVYVQKPKNAGCVVSVLQNVFDIQYYILQIQRYFLVNTDKIQLHQKQNHLCQNIQS